MQHSPNYRELLIILAGFFSGDLALSVPHRPTLFHREPFSLSKEGVISRQLPSGITLWLFPRKKQTIDSSTLESIEHLVSFASTLLEQIDTLQKQWIFEHQHDPLTRLPNRHYFGDALLWAWQKFLEHPQKAYGLIILNIDRFKRINDSMGYLAGDCLLFEVSARLSDVCQGRTSPIRLGGDDFAFLFEHPNLEPEIEIIMEAFRLPFDVFGQNIFLSVSTGSSLANHEHTDEDMIHQEAERALKYSKTHGRGCHTFFDAKKLGTQPDRMILEEDLRSALREQNQIQIYAQYMVDANTQNVCACEILARWHHPQRGILSPAVFMPMVEENHLELVFDRYIIEHVFSAIQQHEWTRWLSIHINLSPKNIHDVDFLCWIDELLLVYTDVHPSQIYFEITEGTLIDLPEKAQYMMDGLHQRGFKLVLDDFGTGYSALSYLSKYDFDELKIDRSFVMTMHQHSKQRNIVSGLIALSHALGMKVVAEGIEHDHQADILRDLGCDLMQGYLFAKPEPWLFQETHPYKSSTHTIS